MIELPSLSEAERFGKKERSKMRNFFMYILAWTCLFAGSVIVEPALAQSSGSSGIAQSDVASAAKNVLDSLPSAAQDKLLVRDLLGAKVTGPDGSELGTVENFAVIPGGRIIAAIVSAKGSGKGRVPVPFSVIKVSQSAGKLDLTVPVSLSELQGIKEVKSLAKKLPGVE